MLTDLKVSSYFTDQSRKKCKRGTPWNLILKVMKCQNEINHRIELIFITFSPEVTIIKMSQIAHFLYILLMTATNQP